MFIFSNAAKNVRRHIRKSAIYFFVCALATLTLQVYIASIDRTQRQLDDLPAAMPISARVANLNGQRFDGLQISAVTVDGLLESAFVRDLKFTVMLHMSFFEKSSDIANMSENELRKARQRYSAVGVSAIEAFEGLTADSVSWLPGYGPELFDGAENACIIDKTAMEQSGYMIGDNIDLYVFAKNVYGRDNEITYELLDPIMLRIVGVADMRCGCAQYSSMRCQQRVRFSKRPWCWRYDHNGARLNTF